ncbi:hypothetical protein GTN31_08565 [Macrococcoides canis]|uniref:hypothetical protein n=1 Tax=Macrococcoides canis TaxID=1855823 RepID=UPI0013E93BB2|nr:hypothetical protein [Macrococcus canis]QIH76415.1 hypothetical protein GTN31_08565 [Macrococcus canis]
MTKLLDLLIQKKIVNEDITFSTLEKTKECDSNYLRKYEKPINDDGFITLILYDFYESKQEFLYDVLYNFINYEENDDIEDSYHQIYVSFKDWIHQKETHEDLLNRSTTAKEKKKINRLFDTIRTIYVEVPKTIEIDIDDDGINYLENNITLNNDDYINSRIYNLTLFEIFKIYKYTGNSLFELNVRNGLKNAQSKELKNTFNNYLKLSIYSTAKSSQNTELVKKLKN